MSEVQADIVIAGGEFCNPSCGPYLANAGVGGTAGCVIAGRLAEARPDLSIVVIEDGKDSKDDKDIERPLCGVMGVLQGSKRYKYYPVKASKAAGGREVPVPVANVLGGGSAVNWLLYQNAAASDFDDWDQPGWSFEELEPYRMRSIKYQMAGDMTVHRTDGAVAVSEGGHLVPIEDDIRKAFAEVRPALPRLNDMADFQHGTGWGRSQKYIGKDGTRSTSAQAFLRDPSKPHDNIRILTGKTVQRVIFQGDTAIGVEICDTKLLPDGGHAAVEVSGQQVIKAKEQVILCAGALGSPAILERSGIGKPEILQQAGVDLKVDSPSVGEGYQDHPVVLWGYFSSDINGLDKFLQGDEATMTAAMEQWEKDRTGLVATALPDWVFKLRPTDEELDKMGSAAKQLWNQVGAEKKDKPMMTGSFCAFHAGDYSQLPKGSHVLSNGLWLNYPGSRGHIHITSSNPHSAPDLETGMLSHPADVVYHIWAYKLLREVFRRLPCYRGEIAAAHPPFPEESSAFCEQHDGLLTDFIEYTAEDDKVIEAAIRNVANTCWHSMSTCQMRDRKDGGVVDARLDVYGVKGLKVADLSICPSNCGTNTASVALIIGEKAAGLILEDLAKA